MKLICLSFSRFGLSNFIKDGKNLLREMEDTSQWCHDPGDIGNNKHQDVIEPCILLRMLIRMKTHINKIMEEIQHSLPESGNAGNQQEQARKILDLGAF